MEKIYLSAMHSVFMTDESIANYFNDYESDMCFKFFLLYCKGWSIPRFRVFAPMKLTRFEYDPYSGKKINWKKIYENNKRKIKGYSEKLEKKLIEQFTNELKKFDAESVAW